MKDMANHNSISIILIKSISWLLRKLIELIIICSYHTFFFRLFSLVLISTPSIHTAFPVMCFISLCVWSLLRILINRLQRFWFMQYLGVYKECAHLETQWRFGVFQLLVHHIIRPFIFIWFTIVLQALWLTRVGASRLAMVSSSCVQNCH